MIHRLLTGLMVDGYLATESSHEERSFFLARSSIVRRGQ